jgi:hypothetical protein
VRPREYLAGIEQRLVVEGALDAFLLGQVGLVEHGRHQVPLLGADAVLAGQHATHLDAQAQDVGAEGLRLLQVARHVGVEQDERVQVAVAGVEDIGDRQAVGFAHVAHGAQNAGKLAAGNGAVHAVVVGRQAADGGESGLAPGPEAQAFVLVPADLHRYRAGLAGDRDDPFHQVGGLGLGTVQLDDDQRLDVQRIARLGKIFGRLDGQPVHDLQTAGNDAGGDHRGVHAVPIESFPAVLRQECGMDIQDAPFPLGWDIDLAQESGEHDQFHAVAGEDIEDLAIE